MGVFFEYPTWDLKNSDKIPWCKFDTTARISTVVVQIGNMNEPFKLGLNFFNLDIEALERYSWCKDVCMLFFSYELKMYKLKM